MTEALDAPLIVVTRPAGEADALAAALRRAGYRVAAVPTVTTRPVGPGSPLDAAVADLDRWDWIVITSAAGARAVFEAVRRTGASLDNESGPGRRIRWAAVGPATAEALAGIGVATDLMPPESTGAAVAAAMAAADTRSGLRVLLARADAASDDLPAALRSAGATVDEVTAYHTLEAPRASGPPLALALADEGLAAIVVASGSAARGLVRLASEGGRDTPLWTLPLISIGPTTSNVARALRFERVVDARHPSVEGLVEAVLETVPSDRTLTTATRRSR